MLAPGDWRFAANFLGGPWSCARRFRSGKTDCELSKNGCGRGIAGEQPVAAPHAELAPLREVVGEVYTRVLAKLASSGQIYRSALAQGFAAAEVVTISGKMELFGALCSSELDFWAVLTVGILGVRE